MICSIVLAAGCSSRMGTQKLLLPFGETTVISHIVEQINKSEIENTYVIVGHNAEKVNEELADKPVTIIHNPEYKTGMLSSVRAGIRNISQNCDGVLIALGDQPSITTNLIDEMVKSFSNIKKKILVPKYDGKRGHPIILSTTFKNEILTDFDDVGLRGILRTHENEIYEMIAPDDSVTSDMDYPEDYQREIDKFTNK